MTAKQANRFILKLYLEDKLFHFDEDVHDCLNHLPPKEIEDIDTKVNNMFYIHGYDPFSVALHLINNGVTKL